MNRLFGKGKVLQPAPNLGDCISNVSESQFPFFIIFMALTAR
jgi:hypothetical protein